MSEGATPTGVRERPAAADGPPRGRAASVAALVVAVASTVGLLCFAPRHSNVTAMLTLVTTAACGALTLLELRHRSLGVAPIAVGIVVVMGVAVAVPPHTSNDLWSYGTYGRMVVEYHADPYTRTPSEFASDPIARHVSPIWRHRSSVYGPLWVGVAGVGAAVAGTDPTALRLFFQLLAALAAALTLLVLWRVTRSPVPIAWLGLHPVFVANSVNNGHADVVIGLAVLAGALLAARHRPGLAGAAIGVVALIKVTALLGLVGIVLWSWRARARRAALVSAGAAVGVLVLGYLPILHAATRVLENADHTVTVASPWNPLADLLVGRDAGRALRHPLAFNPTLDTLFFCGGVLVVVLALTLGWRAAAARDPRPAAGTASAAYPLGAAYSYPWYADWALPSLATGRPTPLAWVVWLQSAVMLAAVHLHIHPTGRLADELLRFPLTDVLPLAFLVAFVVTGVTRARASEGTQGGEIPVAAR